MIHIGYEPKAKDIVDIKNADLFIYVGGTLEPWSSKVVDSINKENTLRLIDCISLEEEMKIDAAESDGEVHEREYDEHIWTSLDNSIKIINYIENKLSKMDSENETYYKENSKKYIEEISSLKNEFEDTIKNSKRKRLVFGDKMPMQYFINEFGLDVSAAFNGCAEETTPTSRTIAYLVDLIKKENIPYVLYLELNEGKVTKTLAEETGCKIIKFQSIHNISKEDFYKGKTYVDLMRENLDVIKKALN